MDEILKYFPDLTAIQKEQFEKLDFCTTIGMKINVISRKDIDALYTKHILHLWELQVIDFVPGTYVLGRLVVSWNSISDSIPGNAFST
jgi:16S rRNA (guanine527-N7)-methyltransferase